MTAPTTDDTRPDTIRDAFEAMLAFLRLLMTPWKTPPPSDPQIAIDAVRVLASWPDAPQMQRLRDLIQRAAEEHNRRALAGDTDMPAERLREMRERCDKATPGPWAVRDEGREGIGIDQAGINNIGSDRFILNEGANGTRADLDFAAHAREDLPAAIAWGERMQAERDTHERVAATWRMTADKYCDTIAERDAEIERLKAELAARAPADASLEARAALRSLFVKLVHVDHMARHLCENSAIDHAVDPANPTAAVDPDDLAALEEALSAVDPDEGHDEQTRARMMAVFDAVDASRPVAPEVDAEDLWSDYRTGRGTVFASDRKAFLAGVAAGRRTREPDMRAPAAASLEAAEQVWRGEWQRMAGDIRSMSEAGKSPTDILAILLTHIDMMRPLAVVRAVDASRLASKRAADLRAITIDWPRTNARRGALMDREDAGTLTADEITELADLQRLADMLVDKMHRDASRPGLTEEQAREIAADVAASFNARWSIGLGQGPLKDMADRIEAGVLRASRGTTGLTEEARHDRHPDGTRDRVEPPDPRATLHAGDPASPFAPGSLAAGSATEDRILDRKRGGK